MIVLQKLSFEIGVYWNTQMLLGVAATDAKITHYSEMFLPPSPCMHTQTYTLSLTHFPISRLLFLSLLILESNEQCFITLDLAASCFAETVCKGRLCLRGH